MINLSSLLKERRFELFSKFRTDLFVVACLLLRTVSFLLPLIAPSGVSPVRLSVVICMVNSVLLLGMVLVSFYVFFRILRTTERYGLPLCIDETSKVTLKIGFVLGGEELPKTLRRHVGKRD